MIRRREVVNLPDGSIATVEPVSAPACAVSQISRYERGELVWEQTYSSFPDEHDAQVARVLAAMVARPGDFTTWDRRPFTHQLELGAA